jgi:hypothetical protein
MQSLVQVKPTSVTEPRPQEAVRTQTTGSMMNNVTPEDWRQLLRLVLAQRLEINAIESALKRANALTDMEIREIRTQASETASAWSSHENDDVLKLIRIHSSERATMLVAPPRE